MADRGTHWLLPLPPALLQTDSTHVTLAPLAPVDYGEQFVVGLIGGFEMPTTGQIWPLPAAVVAPA